MSVFGDPVIFTPGGVPVTASVLTAGAVSLALLVVAALLRWAIRQRPETRLATIAELAVHWPEQLVADIVGRPVPWLAVFSGTLLYFLAGCAVAGQLPGVRTPTSNLAVTSALAVAVFLAVPAAGIRSRGLLGYLRRYLDPSPVMLPFELLSEISRTFALSMRLFGNMLSGYLIVALLVSLVGALVPVPLMALDLLIGLLQAYIFSVLATVYVGAALRAQEA
ncbi:MAG: F0F1 ATP synthase subunit A [Vicinamibacterales bacterium]